eukprot:scaffold7147_cov130-Isochrysis_galbana.AAC.13
MGIDTIGSDVAGGVAARLRDAIDEAREAAPPATPAADTPMSGSDTGGAAAAGAGPASSGGHSHDEVPVAVL